MRTTFTAILLAGTMLSAGCLSTAHRVPRAELQRLAQLPPEQRGQRVRVTQAWAGDEGPPPAPHVDNSTVVVVHSHDHGGHYGGSSGGFRPTAKAAKADAKA